MNKNDDPYRILNVRSDAKMKDITTSYKTLAKEYHPDLNPSPQANMRMQELNWAKEIVGNPEARQKWDRAHPSQKIGFAEEQRNRQELAEAERRRAEAERKRREQGETERRRAEEERKRRERQAAATSFGIGSTRFSRKDGMVQVFVPAGSFRMGSNNGDADEKPVHTVKLDAFWIDRTQVTNEQYEKCVQGWCVPTLKIQR